MVQLGGRAYRACTRGALHNWSVFEREGTSESLCPAAPVGLSPYLHFGQLSAQRAAIEAAKHRSKHSKVALCPPDPPPAPPAPRAVGASSPFMPWLTDVARRRAWSRSWRSWWCAVSSATTTASTTRSTTTSPPRTTGPRTRWRCALPPPLPCRQCKAPKHCAPRRPESSPMREECGCRKEDMYDCPAALGLPGAFAGRCPSEI